jgi:uncharacterized protein (TIGR02271 family)
MTQDDLRARGVDVHSNNGVRAEAAKDELVIPVIEEEASVRVERTPLGKVRIRKTVHTHDEQVPGPLYDERVHVERRVVNREVESPPAVRHDGDTMIIPVVEEVIVKRYLLKEEILVTKERIARQGPQTITLRSEAVDVERVKSDGTVEPFPTQQGETK